MGITLVALAGGTTVTASQTSARLTTVEDFINGGIVAADYQSTAWVSEDLVRRPDLGSDNALAYGSGRAVLETQDIYNVRRSNDWVNGFVISDDTIQDDWFPVHGLYRTVRVFPPRAETTATVIVRVVFYTYEKSGTDLAGVSEAAQFRLFIDGTSHSSCTRRVFNEGVIPTPQGDEIRRVHSMEAMLTGVSRGTHQIGVKCYMNYVGGVGRDWQFVWVKASTFIVRPVYR